MDYLIRNAMATDAPAISQTIINALRQSNAQDYSPEIIDQVVQNFSPPAILQLLAQRQILVATVDNHIVATASLDQDVVRSVFVDPSYQGKGLGRHLMARIQSIAINAGLKLLRVPSSITAEGFYASLGFEKVRDEFHKSERTIIMTKTLDL
ncbi:GNAT family N-acetyltransferase [Pseudomonas sp. SWRI12]|uniref:GNAT family N-acetyltransferase n=1 Tax=Pseudomonas zanjanensis TaxID=2745496 RepID=A0A923JMY3_9PSED|nr:GNAT family N-acetyltransferase [Pseudomonas zanjanensis]MBV4496557.1 GNAT family N-acetyltransferase [Pseudomonas zanjanensis]